MKLSLSHIASDRFYVKARRSLHDRITELEARISSLDLPSVRGLKLHLWMTDDAAYLRKDLSEEEGTTYATFPIVKGIDFRPRSRTTETDLAILINVADGVANALCKAVTDSSELQCALAEVSTWAGEQRNAQQATPSDGNKPAN